VRIGAKISLGCLGIAAFVPVLGWWSSSLSEAVRVEVGELRRSSVRELVGATDMLLALEKTHAAAQELLAERWREAAGAGAPLDAERARDAIEQGLTAFVVQLRETRRATEAALTIAEQHGDARRAAAERLELGTVLDRLSDEFEKHRALLRELVERAPLDPRAATSVLEETVEPHYLDVMFPLIERYQHDSERELSAAVDVIDAAVAEAMRRNLIGTAVAATLAMLFGLWVARSIARPVTGLRDAALRIAEGDWTTQVPDGRRDEIGVLARAFNHMVERLRATTVSKAYVDDVIRSMGEILVVTDTRGVIRSVNRAAEERLGWAEAELVGRPVRELLREAPAAGELVAVARDGRELPVACTPADLHDDRGLVQGQVWVARDIRPLKEIEAELRRSLGEKEILLREVHHRVKNNLQVISSLLRLQAGAASGPETERMFADSEGRIRSMSLIHEQLYRSRDLARIDFPTYVDDLVRQVLASGVAAARAVQITRDVDGGPLDLDVAIPCGLLLNELLSNAMKHAFTDTRGGTVAITFRRDGERASLVVADDGSGPGNVTATPDATTLGMRLVGALARQLRGELTITGPPGTRVAVSFPLRTVPADTPSAGAAA